MSAKPAKNKSNKPPSPVAAAASSATLPEVAVAGAPAADVPSAWIDSSDPRKRMLGKVILVGVWLYVAALWLLALDQTFHWGIFGPKVPPTP